VSTDTVTTFLALLAVACVAFVVTVALAYATRTREPKWWNLLVDTVGPDALVLAAVVAVVATAGSLYLSEVANFPPCRLCWYQRIGMYGAAVVLVMMAIRRDVRAWPYPLALALLSLPVSVYHVALERFPSLEAGACEIANPCSVVWVRHFGLVTIPFMAASGFAAIATALSLAIARARKEPSDAVSAQRRA
jgi:disulfide bond formation protein DsbB